VQLIGHIAKANSEYTSPYMVQRAETKRVGYLIVSDRPRPQAAA
jgi:F-type H+-transporting ATPase subunit gamma